LPEVDALQLLRRRIGEASADAGAEKLARLLREFERLEKALLWSHAAERLEIELVVRTRLQVHAERIAPARGIQARRPDGAATHPSGPAADGLTTVNGAPARLLYAEQVTRIKPKVLLACGWTSLGLGAAGLVLPILPTVPFVLLAAACFLRGSERHYRWLVSHPVFGPHIADYHAGKGLRRRAKIVALVTLWASVLLSVLVFVPVLAADVAMLAVAAAVSVYILRLPTCRDAGDDGPGER
jgi:hypothetical protein